ncbi:MAG TPA: aromatic ring-hydroxylating dioxygenase subunit alpha [Acidimicrobiales bacterium]|jgi:phenylpropionate dioxygenase-like ring-hydroxylating dioxygenase large terminal subunit
MAGGETTTTTTATTTAATAAAATTAAPLRTRPVGPEHVRRALALVDAHATEMAPHILTVPLGYYRDPALAAREQQLCRHTPLALAPSAQLPNPHDFVVRDVLGTSVLLTRDATGHAHAFLNYCRHRGGKPAPDGCGNARRHTCPYHAWSYDSAGRLVGLPGAEGFDGLPRDDYGLVALPTEERHGFVWVVLTVGAPIDVAAHLGPLDAELGAWGLGTSAYLTEREIRADVNWKAAIEAFAENYHFPYVHAQSIVGQNTVANTAIYDGFGRHHRLGFPCPWIEGARDDPDPDPLSSMAFIYWIFPNLTLAMSSVGTEIIDILPTADPTDSGHCVVRHGWMATEPAPNDAVQAGYADLYEAVHAAVRDEDCAVLRGCGEGARAGQHDHMVIGRNEIAVQHVVTTFTDVLGPAT